MSLETEQIKERINIADVVGEYVQLKQAGQSMKGLCPFHMEKTPSFIVTPKRGSWHCFGCGEGGDIFSFVEKVEGIDFPAALKLLAARAGVELKKRSPQAEGRRQRLFELMETATQFYHEVLMNQKAGVRAKGYLAGRGVTEQTMNEFMIGYAPHAWDTLSTWLARKGYSQEEMVAVGLVGKKDSGASFDRFRGRIMFPVRDVQGRVVAFGGRIVPWHETGNEGKYVNSPETALYEKRRTVFNLSRAKRVLRASSACIVVEGYMDVVMLVQAGIENVVATSGTALTSDHVDLLKRFTGTLHFAFDGDGAGFKATISATQGALASGMNVETIILPDEKDPADIAKENPSTVAEILSHTRPLIEVLLGRMKAGTLQDREQALAALAPLLRIVKNPIAQGAMVEQAATILRVPEAQIISMVSQTELSPGIAVSQVPQADFPQAPGFTAENQLLGLLLLYPTFQDEMMPKLKEEFFLDQTAREVYKELQRIHANHAPLDDKYASLCIALQSRAEEHMATSVFSPQEEMDTILRVLKKRLLSFQLKELQGNPREFQAALEKLAEIDR